MAIKVRFELEDVVVEAEDAPGGYKARLLWRDPAEDPSGDAPHDKVHDLGILDGAKLGAVLALAAGIGEDCPDEASGAVDQLYELAEAAIAGCPDGARPIP